MQSKQIDFSCIIKNATTGYKVSPGYLIDEQELVLHECLVLEQRDPVTRGICYYNLVTKEQIAYWKFASSKRVALNRLRQKATRLMHHADITLKALDAYDALEANEEGKNAR